jgi:hypothetical protein
VSQSVTILIKKISSSADPWGCDLEYEVRNDSQAPIWLVNDGWLIWQQTGPVIELSYARGKMRAGSQVLGYFPPAVLQVDSGRQVTKAVTLRWPQSLDRLWNQEVSAAPGRGEYQLSVRVGYGTVPAPDPPSVGEGVEAPVLRWQHEAVSEAAQMVV